MGLTRLRASQISDIDYKQAVRAVTTSNVALNGGAPATVDGVALSLNDRVLVTAQSTGSQNGIYYVTTVGSGVNGTWARSSDTNSTGELLAGTIVMVTEGTTYADTQWKLTTNDPIVIGTTPLTFVINILSQIGGGNTQIQYNNAGTMGASANLTWNGATLYTNGAVSATGNVTGNYILGNGSQLSGVITTVDANTLTGNTLSSNVTNSSLTSVGTLASLSATGNITGSYFVGNGSALTGIVSGGATTFSNTAPSGASAGDVWIQGNTAVQYVYFNDGTSGQWAEMEAAQSFSVSSSAGTPGGANTQIQFNNGNSFGASSNLTFNNATNILSATGNITASQFNGSGAGLTSIPGANVTGTVASATSATSATTAGTVTTAAQGNITSVGILTALSATGNITGNYFVGNGSQLTGTAMPWAIANSNVTMTTSRGYFVDTTGGAKTMTLPASAAIGDTVRINDLAGTFGTNNLTVARNGSNIQGVAQDLLVTVNQSSFGLVYSNSTYGWKLLEF